MNRLTAWSVHSSTLLVGGTGLVYAWMRYFTAPADEFAVVGHPWQPHLQHLHLWTAPLLVFAIGLIWRDHVWRHYRRRVRDRRRSGLSLLLGCAPMIVSGYLIQTAVGPARLEVEADSIAECVVQARDELVAGEVVVECRRLAGDRAGQVAAHFLLIWLGRRRW